MDIFVDTGIEMGFFFTGKFLQIWILEDDALGSRFIDFFMKTL